MEEEGKAGVTDDRVSWVGQVFPGRKAQKCSMTRPEPGVGIYERYTNTSLFKAFYPLFFSMKMTGLYFVRQYPEPGRCRPGSLFPTPSQMFATGCLIIHWLNAFRSLCGFTSNDQFGSELFWKIVYLVFSNFTSLNAAIFYIACYRSDWLPELFIYWEGLQRLPKKSYLECGRKQVLIVVFAWTFLVMFVGSSVYLALFGDMLDMRYWPFTPDMPYFQDVKLAFIILDFLAYSAWLFPMVLTCGICALLFKEFLVINNEISTILGDQEQLAARIPLIRARHQDVCKLVEKADKFLSFHIAASFVSHIFMLCLVLYIFMSDVRKNPDPIVIIICLSWILITAAYLSIGCVTEAMVNTQAHAAFTTIHDMDVTTVTPDFVLQVDMLVSRLGGAPIGLSALNMFVIDKPTILTVIGMLITYLVVLLQFNTSGSTLSHDCAETCAMGTNITFRLLMDGFFSASRF